MNDLPEVLLPHVKGGGSLTALPIIESQEGDVSAYIPTNVISITDGQIFLETKLFNAGVRPAINVGISVSRVGGAAQLKSMKKVAGKLKLAQAQFLELESFAKFGAEIDAVTKRIIDRGKRNRELLNQPPYLPVPVEQQIAVTYAAINGFLDYIPLHKINSFAAAFIGELIENQANTLNMMKKGLLTEEITATLTSVAIKVAKSYSA